MNYHRNGDSNTSNLHSSVTGHDNSSVTASQPYNSELSATANQQASPPSSLVNPLPSNYVLTHYTPTVYSSDSQVLNRSSSSSSSVLSHPPPLINAESLSLAPESYQQDVEQPCPSLESTAKLCHIGPGGIPAPPPPHLIPLFKSEPDTQSK